MRIDPRYPAAHSAVKDVRDYYRDKAGEDFKNILRQAENREDEEKLKEACREMEAIFINLMLRGMRAAVPENGLLGESSAARMYREMLDAEYSKLIAGSRGGLGLAKMLYGELSRESTVPGTDISRERC